MSVCVIQFGAGRAGLQASVRGGDEAGHHIFVVYLKNQLPLYGEWRSKWTDGGYDFDVETVNFGYVNKENQRPPQLAVVWAIFLGHQRTDLGSWTRSRNRTRRAARPPSRFARHRGKCIFLRTLLRSMQALDAVCEP